MRTLPARSALIALAAAAVVSAPTATDAAPAKRCSQLHGRDLSQSRALKVVRHGYRTTTELGTVLQACLRPNGVVRTVGYQFDEYIDRVGDGPAVDSTGAALLQSAGRFVLVRQRAANLTGDFADEQWRVFDVRTGRHFDVLDVSQYDSRPRPEHPLLTAGGRFAAMYFNADDDGRTAGQRTVQAWGADGRRVILDRGPQAELDPASLSVVGRTVSWTRAGVAKTATLP